MPTAREWVRDTLDQLAPSTALRLRLLVNPIFEPEVSLLPALCNSEKAAVDVGANRGMYTHVLLRHCPFVHAFEPLPDLCHLLRRTFRDRVHIEEVAISDRDGQAGLLVRTNALSLSTLEGEGQVVTGETSTVSVQTKTLDSYGLENVGFVKIDVEGHEIEALHGAVKTLSRERPALLVEIEERHRPGSLEEVTRLLGELDYDGRFLFKGQTLPLSVFDAQTHQSSRGHSDDEVYAAVMQGEYVCNFVFLPRDGSFSL